MKMSFRLLQKLRTMHKLFMYKVKTTTHVSVLNRVGFEL